MRTNHKLRVCDCIGAVLLKFKYQSAVATSSVEAEYISFDTDTLEYL